MQPSFNNKAADPFFTKVNYVGAFAGTQTTSDNWAAGWANWTPTTTNYEYVRGSVGVGTISNNLQNVKVVPNPTSGIATVLVDLNAKSNLAVNITDMTGRIVLHVFDGTKSTGISALPFDISSLSAGMYMVHIATENGARTVKLNVIK